MKKVKMVWLTTLLCSCMLVLTACGGEAVDPGAPPEDVINPVTSGAEADNTSEDTNESGEMGDSGTTQSPEKTEEPDTSKDGESGVLEGAVSIRIGRGGQVEHSIDLYDNAAANTMLNYISGNALLFPTYTYDGETGFVGQNIRGSYSRDDEITVADIHTGELYLFSGGQLRLYFKDVEGANISATPVGYVKNIETLSQTIEEAYESNLGDVWGVDVYFWITKTLQ